ncbi:retrotransposable element Tf2 protein type 3 [Trichonephila clavipes]|nr:retrotransposable element Tf2 protein type 3 [Trichonephila clavipes]
MNKKSTQKKYGLLEEVPVAEEPFEMISLDTVGGFNYHNSQKKYLHIVLDHATRYAWTFPSKSVTSETYTICLKTNFFNSMPKTTFLSDRNAAFTSSKFKKFLKHHNIRQLLTSANRPQCNGKNERVNQTLVAKLRCYLSITVEGFESRGVIQGFQCNQFNHTAEHCQLTPKCLKCGDKHQTRDCQIKRLDTPFCINCQVHGHMANYSKCPIFPKPRKGTNIKSNPLISNNFIRPNISYEQATQQTSHSESTQQLAPLATTPIDTQTSKEIPTPIILPTQSSNTQTDCLSLITQTLQQTIHALSTLVQHISQITSPQPASIPPTPCHNIITSKTSLTKTQIVSQINNLLNQYDGASD